MSIVFCGDPHGEFRFLIEACESQRSEAAVIVGDMMLDRPLREALAPLFEAGIAVHYVGGNWDWWSEEWHDRLFLSHPTGNLHATCRAIGGLEIGGHGGVFLDDVWLPHFGGEGPRFRTREEMLRAVPPPDRWRGGLPLDRRLAIVPEDAEALARHRLDVLVCHEAPISHWPSFAAVDDLARRTGAWLVVHGHHHRSYEAVLRDGTCVRGLGMAEPWRLDPAAPRG
ncbi:metallophosphoesterase [Craurococcus roseus]|uniref:Metallophosphoesterase n=1 Tax=Craurococcus roseus TaxID=77585 RepID=A0ABP3RHN6_9PROT